jgi:hypothetical protein
MPPRQRTHKQVPAKVTAYVDEGIRELVELLNTFDSVWSSESCQGGMNEMANIMLNYGTLRNYDPIKTMNFMEKLVKLIRRVAFQEMGLICHGIWVSLEWAGDMRVPYIVIKCAQADIKEVTQIFRCVRNEFE